MKKLITFLSFGCIMIASALTSQAATTGNTVILNNNSIQCDAAVEISSAKPTVDVQDEVQRRRKTMYVYDQYGDLVCIIY